MAEKVEPDEILRILSLMSDLLLTLVRANKILAMEIPGTFSRLEELGLDSKLQEVITAMCEVLASE